MAPPVFNATAESIVADAKAAIEKSRKGTDRIVNSTTPEKATFETVIRPISLDDAESDLQQNVLGFYQAVSADQTLRDASTQADQLFSEYAVEASMREDVFNLVDAVYKKGESLDPESQRNLEKERKVFINCGLNIPKGEKRDRFKEIKLRLSQLAINFSKNLNEEKGGNWFTPAELDGIPEDVLDNLKKGEGENKGKLFLTYKYPDYLPTQDKCKVAATRKKTMIGNENKCNSNIPYFKETIELRDEAARLLGYKNHAAYRLEDKLAKTPEFVDDFQEDLKTRLKAGGEKEIGTLKALKDKDLKSRNEQSDGKYYIWDHRFYNQMMLEQDYQLDSEKVKEYFPLSVTLSRMFEIFEELMGLRFVELIGADRDALSPTGNGKDITWHKDVQMYAVWDSEDNGSGFVGYLYTDLHPREGKYGHAANFGIWPGFTDREGKRRQPATALVCNFSPPTSKKPSLLKHDEVVTLFHELGHGIHDLVGKTTYSRFHGTRVVQDFVEAPSKMLENWCWEPKQIKALGQHYSSLSPEYEQAWRDSAKASKSDPLPAKVMPDDLVANIIKTKHVNEALFTLRQLHFGTFDMAVHSVKSHEEVKALDPTYLYNKMRADIMPMTGPEDLHWGNGQATFGHLMGGYDAGYYGYMIAETYSSDMFASVFKKNPMDPAQGRRYRKTVLEKGGSRDEFESLKEFLGREPNSKAFYEELGLESR